MTVSTHDDHFNYTTCLYRFSYCDKCRIVKFPRTHHCRICGRCIFLLDHHCPWIGNCVGHMNRRFHVQFLVYTALALYTIITTILVLEKGLHPLMVFAVSYAAGFTYNIIFQVRNILDNKTIIERKVGYKAGLEFGKRTKL